MTKISWITTNFLEVAKMPKKTWYWKGYVFLYGIDINHRMVFVFKQSFKALKLDSYTVSFYIIDTWFDWIICPYCKMQWIFIDQTGNNCLINTQNFPIPREKHIPKLNTFFFDYTLSILTTKLKRKCCILDQKVKKSLFSTFTYTIEEN